jgi:hypothetical protein
MPAATEHSLGARRSDCLRSSRQSGAATALSWRRRDAPFVHRLCHLRQVRLHPLRHLRAPLDRLGGLQEVRDRQEVGMRLLRSTSAICTCGAAAS